MVRIEFSYEEAQMLREVLGGYLSDLRIQVRRTENTVFRDILKERQNSLLDVMTRLENETQAVRG